MKIYPSPHQVKATRKPGFMDIPLSHVEKEYHPERIITEINPEFAVSKDSYIAPYQWFTTRNFIAFDDEKKAVDIPLKFNNHKYIYAPAGSKEFSPEEFEFSFVAKRNDRYSSSKDYNIRVGILNQEGASNFAKTMMAIFGDASYRGVSPANVRVNGRDTNPDLFLVDNSENLDWLFIQTKDGVSTKDGSVTALNFDELMSNCCNVWLTLSDSGMKKFLEESKEAYTLKATDLSENELGGTGEYAFTNSYGYQAKKDITTGYLGAGELSIKLGGEVKSPIIILEKDGRGFIVISHENLFSEYNLSVYAPFIYNILVSYHIRGYVRTATNELWITNDVVDYMGSINRPFRRQHPLVNIKDMMSLAAPDAEYFSIAEYSISKPDVMLDQINNQGEVFFSKLLITDPVRENGEVTVFTTQRTVMMYKRNQHRLIEDEVHFLTEIDDDNQCYVTIEPFVSSKNRLIVSTPKRMKIEYVDMDYDIFVLPIGVDGESEVVIKERSKWQTMGSAVKVASVHVEFVGEPAAFDIRMLGGGVPEGYENYEMLDIGNIKGRPYRIGVGAVIELPKDYARFDERIKESVNRYKVAADKIYVTYRE